MSYVLAIIQARMSSVRLPGKALLPLMDKTILELIIQRLQSVEAITDIIVATSNHRTDDILESFCQTKNINYFRGSEYNLLERFYDCAKEYNAEVIVRVKADDPLLDPDVIAKAIHLMEEGHYDYVSNTLEPTYPEGIGIEVFSYKALEDTYLNAIEPSEKEDVTSYMQRHPEHFRIINFKYDTDLSKIHWTVDNQEDYHLIQKVYEELYRKPNEIFRMEEILDLIIKKPELMKLRENQISLEFPQESVSAEIAGEELEENKITQKEISIQPQVNIDEPEENKEELNEIQIENHEIINEQTEIKQTENERTEYEPIENAIVKLETAFAEKIGTKYAIAVANKTCALYAILEAAHINIDDEVIVPALSMLSTTLAVLQANATPVYADVDPNTFLLTPESIKARITSHTRAIITVSSFGVSPDMDAIMNLANHYHLLVVEDNEHCILGTYKGRNVGTLGHAACYGFQNSNHFKKGEGGIIVTDSSDLAQRIERICSLGWIYQLQDMYAAVALDQLEQVENHIHRRIVIAEQYREMIHEINWLKPQYVGENYESTRWSYPIKIIHPIISREEFMDQFIEFGGEGMDPCWKLAYLEPMMNEKKLLNRERLIRKSQQQKYRRGLCPVAEDLYSRILNFKTEFRNQQEEEKQLEAFRRTLQYFIER